MWCLYILLNISSIMRRQSRLSLSGIAIVHLAKNVKLHFFNLGINYSSDCIILWQAYHTVQLCYLIVTVTPSCQMNWLGIYELREQLKHTNKIIRQNPNDQVMHAPKLIKLRLTNFKIFKQKLYMISVHEYFTFHGS